MSCDAKEIKAYVAQGMRYFHTSMTPLIKVAASDFWNAVGEKRI